MGRPKKDPTTKLTRQVSLYLSDEIMAELRWLAAKRRCPVQLLLRWIIDDALEAERGVSIGDPADRAAQAAAAQAAEIPPETGDPAPGTLQGPAARDKLIHSGIRRAMAAGAPAFPPSLPKPPPPPPDATPGPRPAV